MALAMEAQAAVLNTLGFSHGRIRGLVFAEAFIPCLVGAIVGTAVAPLLQLYRVDCSRQARERTRTRRYASRRRTGWALVLALLGGALPAIRAARLPVAEALRAA